MKTTTVLITSPPHDNARINEAQAFLHAAIAQGVNIDHVFFYQAGVYNANSALQTTAIYKQWCELAQNHHIPLLVCVTAAAKRGVFSEAEAAELGVAQATLLPPFEQVGIADFFTRLHDCERLVQF